MKRILKSCTFWFLIIAILINVNHLLGYDEKRIILIGFNPILNKFLGGSKEICDFMNSYKYAWNIASVLTITLYGLIIDGIRMLFKNGKK